MRNYNYFFKEALMPPSVKNVSSGPVSVSIMKKTKQAMRYFITGNRSAVLQWLNEKKWQYNQDSIAVKRIYKVMNSLQDPAQQHKFKNKSGDVIDSDGDGRNDMVSVTLDINLNER